METQTEKLQTAIGQDGNGNNNTVVATAVEYPDNIRSLGDTLVSLNKTQAFALADYLEKTYGIVADSNVVKETPVVVSVVVEEKKEYFDVVMTGIIDVAKKIQGIKAIREATNLGLAESKAFVDDVIGGNSKVVKEALPTKEAEDLKEKLEAVGIKVELK